MKTKIVVIALSAVLALSLADGLRLRREAAVIRSESAEKTGAIAALGYVVHEAWVRDSAAFDTTVRRSAAFEYADSVMCGDWEDVFLNW